MTSVAAYHPGSSVLHRLPAACKLFALLLATTAAVALHHLWQIGLAAAAVTGLFAASRIPAGVVWQQLRPLRWWLAVVGAVQLTVAGWQPAVLVCADLVLAVAMAALLTLTTKVSDILDVCQYLLRPLARVGVDPDRVGLVLAMTIRCLPLLADIVDDAAQARKARGLSFSMLALAAPSVIRALRTADAMGEALIARGADDATGAG